MKRIFCIAIALLAVFLAQFAQAAADPGSCTVSYASINSEVSTITWSWTASKDNGAVPNTASSTVTGWVFMATTDPGAAIAPQDDYDIELRDTDSVDIFGGTLANRDTATSEHAVPLIGAAYYGHRFINGALTMVLTNNNVNSATGTLKIYYYRQH